MILQEEMIINLELKEKYTQVFTLQKNICQLVQPDKNKPSYMYDSFAIGNLHQVSSETYVIYVDSRPYNEIKKYHLSGGSKKWEDVNVVGNEEAAIVILKKGQPFPNTGISKKFNPKYVDVDGGFESGNNNCIFPSKIIKTILVFIRYRKTKASR